MLDSSGRPADIEEKADEPRSNAAITGVASATRTCVSLTRELKHSDRGDLEITDLNRRYVQRGDAMCSGWITPDDAPAIVNAMGGSRCGAYLRQVAAEFGATR